MHRLLIACLACLAVAGPPARAPAGPAAEISIDDFAFTPGTIRVQPGATVRWLNHDDSPHTVVAKSLAFRSKALDSDDSYEHQFNEPGVVDYFCSLHPQMRGQVIIAPLEQSN
jgi:plastocyanin